MHIATLIIHQIANTTSSIIITNDIVNTTISQILTNIVNTTTINQILTNIVNTTHSLNREDWDYPYGKIATTTRYGIVMFYCLLQPCS